MNGKGIQMAFNCHRNTDPNASLLTFFGSSHVVNQINFSNDITTVFTFIYEAVSNRLNNPISTYSPGIFMNHTKIHVHQLFH